MPSLGELTRQYQCALEEFRLREERGEDLEHIAAELVETHRVMETAWLEHCCA